MLRASRCGKILGCALLLFITGSSIQGRQSEWPCGEHPDLLRNKQGKPIWFSSAALKRRAIYKVDPKVPFAGCAEATIIVDVLIDAEGKVRCARTLKGHPILRRDAEQTAKQWKFKPVMINGNTVVVMGRLALHYSWKN